MNAKALSSGWVDFKFLQEPGKCAAKQLSRGHGARESSSMPIGPDRGSLKFLKPGAHVAMINEVTQCSLAFRVKQGSAITLRVESPRDEVEPNNPLKKTQKSFDTAQDSQNIDGIGEGASEIR